MKYFFSALFLIFTFSSIAQNYNCFQDEVKNYFINGNGYVRGIRIDSIRTNGNDTIYYPFHTARISNYILTDSFYWGGYRVDSSGASWLGKKVIRHIDGTYVFDNMWDSVIIKAQAHTGDSWFFYKDSTVYSYTATVTSEGIDNVLGSPDSIKTITINADSAGLHFPVDPVNNFKIILSKNHGFVQIFDLYTFPYHRPDTVQHNPSGLLTYIRYFDYYLDVVLNNLGTCDLGPCIDNLPDTINSIFKLIPFHCPTKMEIYNFDTGDVFERHFNTVEYPLITDIYTLDSVRSKTIMPFNFNYGGKEHMINITTDISAFPWSFDTACSSMVFGQIGDTSHLVSEYYMPEESVHGYILHYFPHLFPGGLTCDSPATYVFITNIAFWYNGIAMLPAIDSDCFSIGFGQTGKTRNYPPAEDRIETTWLSWYHKDTITCGDYLMAYTNTAVNPLQLGNKISISPNPASNLINITANTSLNQITLVTVYDVTGKALFRTNIYLQNTLTINTSSFPDGLYMVIIQDNNRIIQKQKIVINH